MPRLVVTVPPALEGAARTGVDSCSDLACALYPFGESADGLQPPTAFPSPCPACGSYPVLVRGDLVCPICSQAKADQEISFAEYRDSAPLVGSTLQSVTDYREVVLAVDSTFLHPEGKVGDTQEAVEVILELIAAVPDSTQVSLVFFDHVLRALRLNADFATQPLQVDILPGGSSLLSSSTLLPERYTVSASELRGHRDRLEQLLAKASLTSHKAVHASHYPALGDLLDFAVFLKGRRLSNLQLQMIVLTSKSLSIPKKDQSVFSSQGEVDVYDQMGFRYRLEGVQLHIAHIGHRLSAFPQLWHVCVASGGSLLKAEDLTERHFRDCLITHLTNFCCSAAVEDESKSFEESIILDEIVSSLEVRSDAFELDRITGPVVEDETLLALRNRSISGVNLSGSNILLAASVATVGHLTLEASDVTDSLLQYGREKVTVCGLLGGANSNRSLGEHGCMVTLQLRPANDRVGRNQGSEEEKAGKSAKDGVWKSLLPWMRSRTSSSTIAMSSSSSLSLSEASLNRASNFQIVVRGKYLKGRKSSGSMTLADVQIVRFARVWTVSVHPTATQYTLDTASSLTHASFDSSLWGLVLLRGVVADYHLSMAKLLPTSSMLLQSSQAGKRGDGNEDGMRDEEHRLRSECVKQVQHWLRSALQAWGGLEFDRVKLVLARMAYHLTEGPLLNGPSMSSSEAYLLRGDFLHADMTTALRILVPGVWLDLSFVSPTNLRDAVLPSSTYSGAALTNPLCVIGRDDFQLYRPCTPEEEAEGLPALYPMPPDCTSLLPGSVALVDLGNALVVLQCDRIAAGSDSSGDSSWKDADRCLSRLASRAQTIAKQRHPRPLCYLLGGTDATSPHKRVYKRVALSRLSPTHCAPQDVVRAMVASVSPVRYSGEELDALRLSAPYSDSPCFLRYLLQAAPALYSSLTVTTSWGTASKAAGVPLPSDQTDIKPVVMQRTSFPPPLPLSENQPVQSQATVKAVRVSGDVEQLAV
eukprot:scaffold2822_cov192-Ochromonas_danica.AAC.6